MSKLLIGFSYIKPVLTVLVIAQPERQSDPAIYRELGRFSKILSRWLYLEFKSAYNHRDCYLIFGGQNFFTIKSHMFSLDIMGKYYRRPVKILENPRESGKLGAKVPRIDDKYCNMSASKYACASTNSS